jgi:hypothetical protein
VPNQRTANHTAPRSRPSGRDIHQAAGLTTGLVPDTYQLADGPLDAYATSGSSPPAEYPSKQAPFSIETTPSTTGWLTLSRSPRSSAFRCAR